MKAHPKIIRSHIFTYHAAEFKEVSGWGFNDNGTQPNKIRLQAQAQTQMNREVEREKIQSRT